MRRVKKWYRVTIAVTLVSLFSWTCGTDFRDALITGAFDFVSGTVTSALFAATTPPAAGA
jgi:hypothetical protein